MYFFGKKLFWLSALAISLFFVPNFARAAETLCCINIGASKTSYPWAEIKNFVPSTETKGLVCDKEMYKQGSAVVPGRTFAKVLSELTGYKSCDEFASFVVGNKVGPTLGAAVCAAFGEGCDTKTGLELGEWCETASSCFVKGVTIESLKAEADTYATKLKELTTVADGTGGNNNGGTGTGSGTGSGNTPAAGNTNGDTLFNPLANSGINMDKPVASLAAKAINLMFGISGSIALVMFVYGGFRWLISAGNSKGVEAGKQAFIWASFGLMMMFSSYIVVRYVFGNLLTNAVPGAGDMAQKLGTFNNPKPATPTGTNQCAVAGIPGTKTGPCSDYSVCLTKDAAGKLSCVLGKKTDTVCDALGNTIIGPATDAKSGSNCNAKLPGGGTTGGGLCYTCESGKLVGGNQTKDACTSGSFNTDSSLAGKTCVAGNCTGQYGGKGTQLSTGQGSYICVDNSAVAPLPATSSWPKCYTCNYTQLTEVPNVKMDGCTSVNGTMIQSEPEFNISTAKCTNETNDPTNSADTAYSDCAAQAGQPLIVSDTKFICVQ